MTQRQLQKLLGFGMLPVGWNWKLLGQLCSRVARFCDLWGLNSGFCPNMNLTTYERRARTTWEGSRLGQRAAVSISIPFSCCDWVDLQLFLLMFLSWSCLSARRKTAARDFGSLKSRGGFGFSNHKCWLLSKFSAF